MGAVYKSGWVMFSLIFIDFSDGQYWASHVSISSPRSGAEIFAPPYHPENMPYPTAILARGRTQDARRCFLDHFWKKKEKGIILNRITLDYTYTLQKYVSLEVGNMLRGKKHCSTIYMRNRQRKRNTSELLNLHLTYNRRKPIGKHRYQRLQRVILHRSVGNFSS